MPEVDGLLLSEVTEDAIALLVGRFYAKIRQEPVLGPIFDSAILPEEWPTHLAKMRRFWSSVMLASGSYSGNPAAVHRAVPDLQRPMFARWLVLWEVTARELFVPDVAVQFATKAQRIAFSLQMALFHRARQPPAGLASPPRTAAALAGHDAS